MPDADSDVMTMSPVFEVPANASRFLPYDEAIQQPVAKIELGWRFEDPYLFNTRFDPSLIHYDEHYYTSAADLSGPSQVPTLEYFESEVMPLLGDGPKVLDIGCGQGDFVDALASRGIHAVGYDPTVRAPTARLKKRYWSPEDETADVFVMRCVLPHLERPWEFLDNLAAKHPDARVLVEFQRLEWILDQGIWYQLSHDHVNLFSVNDLAARYDVVADGQFANGEWAWVLLDPSESRRVAPVSPEHGSRLDTLFALREGFFSAVRRDGRPFAIWGAAGKGIVLAHAMASHDVRATVAIDADPVRQGLCLEVSGLAVISPDEALELPADTVILVANPNHLADVQAFVGDRLETTTPSAFVRDAAAGSIR